MVTLTKAQRKAVHRVFLRKYPFINELRRVDQIGMYRKFRKTVQPALGMDCVMLPFAGMWLGIETDGYTHS